MQGWRGMVTKIMQSIGITSRPPWEKGSGTSWAKAEEHLAKYIITIEETYLKDISLRWQLHDPVLLGWSFNLSSRAWFYPSVPAIRGRFPPGICLEKSIDSHGLKNLHKMMKFYKNISLLFSHILTSYML